MIIYKTTNLIDKKFYIGKDKYNNPNYIGSGKLLHKAIKKYGVENFQKEVIEECYTEEQLNEREKFWIKILNATDRKIGYNISIGGEGGDTITNNPNKLDVKKKMSDSRLKSGLGFTEQNRIDATKSRKLNHPGYGSNVSEETKKHYQQNHSNKIKNFFIENGHWGIGKKRSEEACKNIGDAKRGEKHYNYGKNLEKDLKEKISKSVKKSKNPFKIKITDMHGIETIVETMGDAEVFVNGSRGYIKACLMKYREFYKNYKFEYLLDNGTIV